MLHVKKEKYSCERTFCNKFIIISELKEYIEEINKIERVFWRTMLEIVTDRHMPEMFQVLMAHYSPTHLPSKYFKSH